ncbi:MAG TPA: endonuclease III domain-containing protein [Dissulfurispiraceae bacterium]|nr:endonuclease III domain-containing protein [Dissulfurispiraceae bacterium]
MNNAKPLRSLSLYSLFDRLNSFYGSQHWWPADTTYETAVGAILTQNTNWGNVEKAISNLKKHKALNAQTMKLMSLDRLAELIRPSGYYNIKAKRLRAFVEYLVENHNGNMARMRHVATEKLRAELLAVNGIGQETADSILLYAVHKPVFVIDAYTKRVLSRHGLMDMNASYAEYQQLFHSNLQPDVALYNEYHALLVRVGKEHCKPLPQCDGCPLSTTQQ